MQLIDQVLSKMKFQYDPEKDAKQLLASKEGRYLILLLRNKNISTTNIEPNTRFVEDLAMSEEQYYTMLASMEMQFVVDIPKHLLPEINSIGYLIQLLQYLRKVYG